MMCFLQECLSEQTEVDFEDQFVYLDVEPGLTIKRLKEQLYEEEGHAPEDLSLFVDFLPLSEELTVGAIAKAKGVKNLMAIY